MSSLHRSLWILRYSEQHTGQLKDTTEINLMVGFHKDLLFMIDLQTWKYVVSWGSTSCSSSASSSRDKHKLVQHYSLQLTVTSEEQYPRIISSKTYTETLNTPHNTDLGVATKKAQY